MVVKAKVFVSAKRFVGELQATDFLLTEECIDSPSDGEFIAAAMYFGINAGLRAYQDLFPIGSVIVGGQVAKYCGSLLLDFPMGLLSV